MNLKEIATTVKQKTVEKLTTMLVVGVVSLLTFSYIAWADNRYVQHTQLAQLEVNLIMKDIADEIKELRRMIRAAKLDKQDAQARNDAVAASRADADVLFFEDEISALQEERDALKNGN